MSVVSGLFRAKADRLLTDLDLKNVHIYAGASQNLIANAFFSLTTSGTVTLEHAVLGTPCLVAYRFGWISYSLIWALKQFKFRSIKYISLPNLLANAPIVPEFVQYHATAHRIAESAIDFLKNPSKLDVVKAGLKLVREGLGDPGAAERSAQAILDEIHHVQP